MNNTKIFQNTWTLQQLPTTMTLTNVEWRFLLCADGKTPVEQIQRRLGLTEKERDYILSRLCTSNLLTERPVSLEEYAKSTIDIAAPTSAPQTFTEYLKSTESPESSTQETVPAFSPLQKPSATSTPVRTMSLQSVIQFILNQNPDPTAGHLATYQVFMGIDTQLLKRNGITSLRFQDDRFITDAELQKAIIDNIQKVLGMTCPEDVFTALSPADKN
jgi:hypothetical protein